MADAGSMAEGPCEDLRLPSELICVQRQKHSEMRTMSLNTNVRKEDLHMLLTCMCDALAPGWVRRDGLASPCNSSQ